MKNFFIVSASLLLISAIFLLAYNIAFKKSEIEKSGSENKKERVFSELKKGKIYSVTEEKVVGKAFLDRKNEKISYYSAESGDVFEIDLDGRNKRSFSVQEATGLREVEWSLGGDKALLNMTYGYRYFDFTTKKNIQLKSGVDTVAWNNDGTRIFYKYFEQGENQRSINVSDPDGGNWKKLSDIGFRDVMIAPVPQTSMVSFWNKGRAGQNSEFFMVGAEGGEAKKIFSGKNGADFKWSPNGKKAFVSHLKEQGGLTTALIDTEGFYEELGIPTISSKIVWSLDSRYIFYALPSYASDALMPDDYKSGKIKTTDTFWKINTENGEKTRLIKLEDIGGEYDADELFLSPSENLMFFTNRKDGKIYRLEL